MINSLVNYARESSDKIEKCLRKAVIMDANNHIGKKKIAKKFKSYLNAEVKESIKNRNILSKVKVGEDGENHVSRRRK